MITPSTPASLYTLASSITLSRISDIPRLEAGVPGRAGTWSIPDNHRALTSLSKKYYLTNNVALLVLKQFSKQTHFLMMVDSPEEFSINPNLSFTVHAVSVWMSDDSHRHKYKHIYISCQNRTDECDRRYRGMAGQGTTGCLNN